MSNYYMEWRNCLYKTITLRIQKYLAHSAENLLEH